MRTEAWRRARANTRSLARSPPSRRAHCTWAPALQCILARGPTGGLIGERASSRRADTCCAHFGGSRLLGRRNSCWLAGWHWKVAKQNEFRPSRGQKLCHSIGCPPQARTKTIARPAPLLVSAARDILLPSPSRPSQTALCLGSKSLPAIESKFKPPSAGHHCKQFISSETGPRSLAAPRRPPQVRGPSARGPPKSNSVALFLRT